MKLKSDQSMFCQALAMTSLVCKLSNNDFLQSKYYQNLHFTGNDYKFKKILEASGLGNPATMQMFLYILLVMPKELLDKSYLNKYSKEINLLFSNLIYDISTTYNEESDNDLTKINFYRHTRNAVSHSNCFYKVIDNVCYVTFKDVHTRDASQHCEFTLKTADVGKILEKLQIQIMSFLNEQWSYE